MFGRSLLPCLFVLCGLLGQPAHAQTIVLDDFATNPFDDSIEPRRWCERFHHVHWIDDDQSVLYQSMIGMDGTCCEGIDQCGPCSPIAGVAGSCGTETCGGGVPVDADLSDWPNCRHLLVTTADHSGAFRAARVEFGVPEQLSLACDAACPGCPGEHIKVVAAAHPSCEASLEARVITRSDDPTKQALQIRSVTTPRAGFPECGSTPVEQLSTIDANATFELVPSATPNYEITINVYPHPAMPAVMLYAEASLKELSTSTTVATVAMTDLARPAWYNVQAKRFAIGGLYPPKALGPAVYDNFEGGAFSPTDPSDPNAPNGAHVTPPDLTVPTDLLESIEFLFSANPSGVAPLQTVYDDPQGLLPSGTFDPKRIAVVRGQVFSAPGVAAEDTRVSVLSHHEFGQTLARIDGKFDFAVNGGGPLTIVYEREGYLTAHRRITVPWGDYIQVPDVILVAKDPNVTSINLDALEGADASAVARGSEIPDDDGDGPAGPRQAILLFPPDIQAWARVREANGTITDVPLSEISVRATEYTVDPFGLEKMPAELPPSTAFTYAAEFTVDEADALGAFEVTFSTPVIFYLDSFLPGFLPPEVVPAGYYDRERAVWIPSESGQVVSIVGVTGGMADVDTDGNGSGDNAGIPDPERVALFEVYGDPGSEAKILWRVPIPHFSPWDCNWPEGPAVGAGSCWGCFLNGGDSDKGGSCSGGSVIGCEDQTLGESMPIVGTPFRLHYKSDRVLGRADERTLRLYLKADGQPSLATLLRVEIEVSVAGQVVPYTITIDENDPQLPSEPYEFTWDGEDVYGRQVQGRVPAVVRVGFVYRSQYGRVSAFGEYPQATITGSRGRREITFWETRQTWLESWDARAWGIGGWTLDVHHAYDPASKVLLLGDGTRRAATDLTPVVSTFAGGGSDTTLTDGIPATDARFNFATGVAIGADGSVFVGEANRVRRITPNGLISRIAGQPTAASFNGNEGPSAARSMTLGTAAAIAVGPDESLYVADPGHHRIRRIYWNDSTATYDMVTLAGNSPCPPAGCVPGYFIDSDGDGQLDDSPEGEPATTVRMRNPGGIAVGSDGTVYVADTGNHIVRRIATDGTIRTIAGTPLFAGSGGDEGTLAANAQLSTPNSIAIDREGNLYVVTTGDRRVRKIARDGTISTVAGMSGQSGIPADGSVATQAKLVFPTRVSIGLDGSLLITDRTTTTSNVIRRVSPAGIITTIVGNGLNGSLGDGGPARLASFNTIQNTASDPDGNLYLADSTSNKVRRVGLSDAVRQTSGDILIPSSDASEVYVFNASGQHQRTRDALTGAAIYEFDYDGDERLKSVTDRSGNIIEVNMPAFSEHPSSGTGTIVHERGGQVTSFSLGDSGSDLGYLTTIGNPANEVTTFGYVGGGLLASMTDPLLNTYLFDYDNDGLGRLTEDADPEGLDADPPAIYKTLARINESAREYTVAMTTALGRTTAYVTELLATGALRRFRTNPDGTSEERVFGLDDSREVTHADGTIVKLSSGPEVGRFGMEAPVWSEGEISTPLMRAASPPQAATIVTTRTATLASVNDPFSLAGFSETFAINGRTFTRSYNPTTKVITGTSPQGRVITTTLDAQGRVSKTQVAGLNETRYEYDTSRGRLETIKQGVPGVDERVWELGYDTKNRLTSVTNPLAEVMSFGHDLADRVTTQTLPDMEQIGFAYDAAGNMTSLIPAGKPAHGFAYTKLNLEKSYQPPDPSPAIADPDTRYAYNLDRQIEMETRPRALVTDPDPSVLIDYQYDLTTGRLSKMVLPTGQGEITYAYDAAGRLQTITGPDLVGTAKPRTLTYTYDGFLPSSTTWGCAGGPPCPSGTIAGSVSREYDDSFRVVSQRVNGAHEVVYGYDNDDLVTSVTDGAAVFEITRDPQKDGLVTSTKLTNGAPTPKITDTRTYDLFGDIATYEARYNDTTLLYSVTYARDGLGRIAAKSETIAKASGSGTDAYDWEYTYDTVGRLDTVKKNGFQVADYDYDENGNRIAGPGLMMPPAYDDQDRLITFGPATYAYAPNGELASRTVGSTTTTYEYGALGELRQASLPNVNVEYVVDGTGRRVGRVVSTISPPSVSRSGLLYDGALQPVAATDDVGAVTERYVQATQAITPDVMIGPTATYRVISDHLGSVRLLVNLTTGAIVQRLDYDEFGVVTADSAPGAQPFGFAGGLHDQATMLVRFGKRDYDATLGRWTTKDPMRFKGHDTNLYRYADSDPINRVDPTGLQSCGPGEYQRCTQACRAGTAGWQAFCRTLPDPRLRFACWGMQFASFVACSNWCYWYFGAP